MFAHLVSLEIVEDKIHIYICSALRTYHNSGHKKMVTLTQGWKELKFLMSAILYQYPLNKFFKILVSFVLGLVAQSCPTLCNTMDFSLPSSSVHGILQARILKRVAMPSSRGSSQPKDQTHVSHIQISKFQKKFVQHINNKEHFFLIYFPLIFSFHRTPNNHFSLYTPKIFIGSSLFWQYLLISFLQRGHLFYCSWLRPQTCWVHEVGSSQCPAESSRMQWILTYS